MKNRTVIKASLFSICMVFLTAVALFMTNSDVLAETTPEPITITPENQFEANSIDGIYTITKYKGNDETVVVPAAIQGHKVRAISSAFVEKWSVRTVYLPDTLEIIGKDAFSSCAVDVVGSYTYKQNGDFVDVETPSVETGSVISPSAVISTVESGSIEISNPVACDILPSHLTTIGEKAFYNATNLKAILLPTSIQSIGDSAFINTNISDFTIPTGANVDSLGTTLFGSSIKTITVNGHISTISDRAFEKTSNLDTFTLNAGASVDSMGAYAFSCSGIHYMTINGSIDKIGNNAFEGAGNLLAFTVNEGGCVKELGDYVFYTSGVHEVTLRGAVSSIGDYAFALCSNVDTVTVDSTSPYTLGEYAFTCAGIHNVDFSEGLTTVDKGTFEKCGNLQVVNLPETLTHIGEDAFKDVSNIKEITINDKVTVDPTAFEGVGGSTVEALKKTNNTNVLLALSAATTPAPTPTPVVTPAPTPVPTVAPVKKIKVSSVKLKKLKKKKKKATLTWSKNKKASGYTIYKKVVKKGTKAKKAKKIKFIKVKNVKAKSTKLTVKLSKKCTTTFYVKAFIKTKANGKSVTYYSKASNTKKVVS